MKKLGIYFLLAIVGLTPVFQSCNDDDGYSLGNYLITMATVERDSDDAAYPYFRWDNNEAVWVAASQVPFKQLKSGQRVVANFTLLSDREDKYAHDVRLNDYRTVLTKGIVDLTANIEDSIGNSKATITKMWMDNDYLNVLFWVVMPSNERHRVNLVRNLVEVPDESDGYLHLEFRYNDMGDTHGKLYSSIVSFKLNAFNSITEEVKPKGLKVRINSIENGDKVITLNYPTEYKLEEAMFPDSASSEEMD